MTEVGPLSDITVIDCTMALAGPFGTAILADLGANVIKVEPPRGDGSRSVPPIPRDFTDPGSADPGCDYGGYFASINRNKRSIVLDLKQERDVQILLDLCSKSDAIVENMRDGVMDRLGAGYDVIKERNPRIVYGCIRGFGDSRTGESPYTQWPAFDIVAQSMSGVAHTTGPAGHGGFPCGLSIGDLYPGTLLALGVIAAVHHAKRTGEGQFMDISMYDALLFLSETIVVNYGYNETSLGPRGAHHPNLCPFGIFPTSDGAVSIAAPGPGHWQALCEAMDRPELIDDERTQDTFARRRHQQFVEGIISEWTQTRTKKQVVDILGGQVPCGPVNTAADIFADPHVEARGMIDKFNLPGQNDPVSIVASPFKYTATPTHLRRRPPCLDEHREEILNEMGINDSNGGKDDNQIT